MNLDKIRNVLNIMFMILAVISIIIYFTMEEENKLTFIYVCGSAVVVKIVEYMIRFASRYIDKEKK